MDRAAAGFSRRRRAPRPDDRRCLLLQQGDQRGQLRRAEVHADPPPQQQHRQLQPDLTRPIGRRSGDHLRGRRRHQLLSRSRRDGPHRPLGFERARNAPDLLPPRPPRRQQRCPPLRRRPAPDEQRGVGGRLARPRRRERHRPRQRHRARDHPGRPRQRRLRPAATVGFDAYRANVEPYTLEFAQRETGVPADQIRALAHAYATAPTAMICWTLGITEHHNAVDNVISP